jgi:hypothetical protein
LQIRDRYLPNIAPWRRTVLRQTRHERKNCFAVLSRGGSDIHSIGSAIGEIRSRATAKGSGWIGFRIQTKQAWAGYLQKNRAVPFVVPA